MSASAGQYGGALSLAGNAPPCCPAYKVKPGDTADSVASAQSVSPNLLKAFNSLPADAILMPGQSIQIPCARVLEPIAKAVIGKQKASVSPVPSPASSAG